VSELEQPTAGRLPDALRRLAQEQRIMTPSIAVRRKVYEALGGFDKRLACSEDWEMWVRIAAHYAVWYEPRVLASYRMHQASNTGRHYRLAEELEFTRQAIEIFRDYLPPDQTRDIRRRARAAYAATALRNARGFAKAGDRQGMYAHLRAAIRLSARKSMIKAVRIALSPHGGA